MSGTKLKAQMSEAQLTASESKKARERATRPAGEPTHYLVLACACPHRAYELKVGAVIVRPLQSACPLCGSRKQLVRLPLVATTPPPPWPHGSEYTC